MPVITIAVSEFTIGLLTLVIPGAVLAIVWAWYWLVWRGHLAQP